MGIKDTFNKIVHDAADAVSEVTHRSEADAEQAKRDVAGKDMTLGEHVSSTVNQAKHETLADVDHAKRDIRDNI